MREGGEETLVLENGSLLDDCVGCEVVGLDMEAPTEGRLSRESTHSREESESPSTEDSTAPLESVPHNQDSRRRHD